MADITQEIKFSASPKAVYDLLTDEKKFSQLTNASAKIDAKIGGSFSVWDDFATGKFEQLVPSKKIIQTWRASDWPEGADSTVSFNLVSQKKGCLLKFSQANVPDSFAQDIKQGWQDYYWSLMHKYLEEQGNV